MLRIIKNKLNELQRIKNDINGKTSKFEISIVKRNWLITRSIHNVFISVTVI